MFEAGLCRLRRKGGRCEGEELETPNLQLPTEDPASTAVPVVPLKPMKSGSVESSVPDPK